MNISVRVLAPLALSFALGLSPVLAQETKEDQKAKTEQQKPLRITEEIQVVGKKHKDVPLATVATVVATEIERLKPRDLSDVIKFIPGSMVTSGDKDTYNLKLRVDRQQPNRPPLSTASRSTNPISAPSTSRRSRPERSIEEFITHALEKEIALLEEADSEEEIKKKLQGLGYID